MFLGLNVRVWGMVVGLMLLVYLMGRFLLPEKTKQKHLPTFLLMPSILAILFMVIYPLVYAFRLAFLEWHAFAPPQFVGLNNFLNMFLDYKFWSALGVTMKFVAIAVPVEVVVGLLVAVLLNRQIRGKNFLRTLITLPIFVCPVALGFVSLSLYDTNGPVNAILKIFGFQPIAWLGTPNTALASILLLEIWQWTPFCFLVFLSGLQNLSGEIYEAAYLETNSSLAIFRYLTLPLIKPIVATITMLRLLETLKVFDLPMSLTKGGPGFATETYSIMTYKVGLRQFSFGDASARAFFFLFLLFIIFTILFKIGKFSEIYE